MTSYEEQLQNFGKEIDDLEEKRRQDERKKRNRSTSTNAPSNTLLPPSSSKPQKPQMRVVGFGVEAETTALLVPQSKPVSIPVSSSPVVPSKPKPFSPPSPGSPQTHSPVHAAPRSMEELKSYESQIEGWSDSPPSSSSPSPSNDFFSFEKAEKPELQPKPEVKEKPAPEKKPDKPAPEKKPEKPAPEKKPEPQAKPPSQPGSATASPGTTPSPTSIAAPPTPTASTNPPAAAPQKGAANPPVKGAFVKPPKVQLSRAERRALQEEQRAAKAARTGKPVGKPAPKEGVTAPAPEAAKPPRKPQGGGAAAGGAAGQKGGAAAPGASAAQGGGEAAGGASAQATPKKLTAGSGIREDRPRKGQGEDEKQHPLFSHLPQYRKISSQGLGVGFAPSEKIHPAIIELGLKYANNVITGSNARCVAMLTAFKDVIRDYNSPPGTALHRTLEPHLKPQIQFLTDCRPHSISMGTAINFIKREIPKTQICSTEEEAKERLINLIDNFIKERIVWADKAIAEYGVTKINDGDVILTYARSHSVQSILEAAQEEGKKFRVIIVDSRPKREGKELLRMLTKLGVNCTYVLINAVSYVMKEATKVFVGAFALLANGNVMSRAGTAVVAMMAQSYGVPVIACCETYKFCERIQIDSICFNELADPDELVKNPDIKVGGESLQDWRQRKNLKLLNLAHDVTPASFVTLVVTEVGMIPPTSVPVVLREYAQQ